MHIPHELAPAGGVHRVVAQRKGVKDQRVCGFLVGHEAGDAVVPAQLCRQGLGIVSKQAVKRGVGAAPCQQIGGAGGQNGTGNPQGDHGQHQLLEQAGVDPAQRVEVMPAHACVHSCSSA